MLEGVVRDVAFGGEAVVETEAGLVFAPFGLTGERVRVRDVRRSGKVLRGRIDAVHTPAPERVTPPCPIVERCGGCPLMAMARPAQHAHLRGLVARAVARAPGGEPLEVALVSDGASLGYRRRARLAFRREREGSAAIVGYRTHRSHRIVDVAACAVLDPVLATALEGVRAELAPVLRGEGEVQLARGQGGATVLVTTAEPEPPEAYDAARALARDPAIAGVALQAGGASAPATFGDPREVLEGVDGHPLRGSVGGFSQANAGINAQLVEHVVRLAEPEGADVLELYAGHGNLTVALAVGARSLVAVEQDPGAVAALRDNLRDRGLSATVRRADAREALEGRRTPVDVVVLDPPRRGARDVLEPIAARRPSRIVYVSCDPPTLGRDLAELGRLGFRVDAATAFDMFPHTGHVEAVVRLSRD